ncbi:MAG: site-2 protease family protein, partial [Clostridia bacterium]|nr:site-2 protease family protein [Clostridia bacterium]
MNLLASNFFAAVGNFLSSYVWPVILALLILLAMITVHEFGHYIAGKILKFKINEFAIGFGPVLFKRKSKKTGEVFSIRALPLGGFCAFAGEDEDVPKTEEPVFEEELKLDADCKEEQKSQVEVVDTSGYFNNKAPWKRIIVLISGALMNYILAIVLIVTLFMFFGQPTFQINAIEQNENYSAEYSLCEGDVLLEAEGRKIYVVTDIMKGLKGKSQDDIATLTVLREGEKKQVQIKLRHNCNFENSADTSKVWKALGLGTVERAISIYSYKGGFFYNLGSSFGYSFRIAGTIFNVLGELLTGKLGLDAMGGPITTIKVTSEVAAQGVESFLEIAAYIGVNLAVFNLLPIPALDGSKVVFCAIEWIFKKPVPRKLEAIIHAAGLILILLF